MSRHKLTLITAVFGLCLLVAGVASAIYSPTLVAADPIGTPSIQLERINETTESGQEILLYQPAGVGAGESFEIGYPTGEFTFGAAYDYTDMSLEVGDNIDCDLASFSSKTLGASASGTTWGATYLADTVTFQSGTDTIAANVCIRITLDSNGGTHSITNPTVSGNTSFLVFIEGPSIYYAPIGIVILDDAGTPDGDQIEIRAILQTAISMDIDIVGTNCANSTENAAPYTIDLGELSPAQVKVSSGSIPFICVDLGTNSGGGVKLSARSSYAAATGAMENGATADTIDSATADLTSGAIANGYGIRVVSTGTTEFGTLTITAPFNNASQANVGALPGASATAASIVTSSAPVQTGTSDRIQIEVAAKAGVGKDPGDYSDTIVFTAMINL